MNTYITLLRGINVGGNKKIPMSELRELYESLKFQQIKTYINSGNVIFETERTDKDNILSEIERGIKNKFGFKVKVILISKEDLVNVISRNPFETLDKKQVAIAFLSEKPKEVNYESLNLLLSNNEEYKLIGTELYIFYGDGQAKTTLTTNAIEKALGVTATVRKLNTINKVLAK